MVEGSEQDKRMMRRFAVELPMKVTAKSGEELETVAKTRDVSSHGICFYCNAAIERESVIEFVLTLPAEITMSEPISVHCHGTVVRVEGASSAGNKFTIAASIDSYEFVSEDGLRK